VESSNSSIISLSPGGETDSAHLCGNQPGSLAIYSESVLRRYEEELYQFAEKQHPEILGEIKEKRTLDAELGEKSQGIFWRSSGEI